MKKSKDVTMKDAIQQMLKTYHMEDRVVALKVEELWPEIIGATGAKYTKGFRFRGGLLTIITEAAALRQEISMSKTLVIHNINEKLGGEVVKDIQLL